MNGFGPAFFAQVYFDPAQKIGGAFFTTGSFDSLQALGSAVSAFFDKLLAATEGNGGQQNRLHFAHGCTDPG
jgi:hypothetical protein